LQFFGCKNLKVSLYYYSNTSKFSCLKNSRIYKKEYKSNKLFIIFNISKTADFSKTAKFSIFLMKKPLKITEKTVKYLFFDEKTIKNY
jgi:hypothetical protein